MGHTFFVYIILKRGLKGAQISTFCIFEKK